MKKIVSISSCVVLSSFLFAQPGPVPQQKNAPKLIVGIVVDQMRADYIYKYWNKYGNDGFRRLVNEGYSCKNTNYNYVPTYTAPGHASVYTGSTPCVHGIVGNNWYDKSNGKNVYCVEDYSVHAVGGNEKSGQMSPKNLLSTTIGDQLKLSDNMGSKVIGIALKDRGAILPAGHSANAAYWFDPETGNWISSTYYMKELPSWVNDFNKKGLTNKYTSQPWNLLLPPDQYSESVPDDNKYEGKFSGENAPVFPHDIPKLLAANGGAGLIRSTPFGNSLTKDFAIQTITSENLGKGNFTDMLCVSFSSTDFVGHMYGPQSMEVEDTYLRLDKDIAELLKFLDGWVGKGNVVVFLTADHGGCETPAYLNDHGIPGGNIDTRKVQDTVMRFLFRHYGDSLVKAFYNQEFYLDHNAIENKKLDIGEIERTLGDFLVTLPGVAGTVPGTSLKSGSFPAGVGRMVQNGFWAQRSGDIYVSYAPGWLEYGKTGTSHGSPYPYDTHVPLLWYGWNIRPGSTDNPVEIPDIVATLSLMLDVQSPDGCTGHPISTLVK